MFNVIVQVWEQQEPQENFPVYHQVPLGLEWANAVTWTGGIWWGHLRAGDQHFLLFAKLCSVLGGNVP